MNVHHLTSTASKTHNLYFGGLQNVHIELKISASINYNFTFRVYWGRKRHFLYTAYIFLFSSVMIRSHREGTVRRIPANITPLACKEKKKKVFFRRLNLVENYLVGQSGQFSRVTQL